jgi:hypothetical protein
VKVVVAPVETEAVVSPFTTVLLDDILYLKHLYTLKISIFSIGEN